MGTSMATPACMPAIREQLRAARIEAGLSLNALAEWMHGYVAGADIAGWESGRKVPSVLQLDRWATALGHRISVAPIGDPS